ncbi:MAG: hypothetical protein U0746_19880 [Gemmataceae bacterium]
MTTRRRPWFGVAGLVMALVAITVGWLSLRRDLAERRLAAVVARLDADDPGWRLDDLEAARASASDLGPLLAGVTIDDGPMGDGLARRRILDAARPPVRLTADQLRYFGDTLAANEAALRPAFDLAGRWPGRFTVARTADVVSTRLDHVGQMGLIGLLTFEPEFYLAAQRGDAAAALRACRAEWNLGRPLHGEPWLASQRDAVHFRGQAVAWYEVLLARFELPDADLAAVQRDLADELADDPWATSVRGQRAYFDAAMLALRSDDLTPEGARAAVRRRGKESAVDKVRGWATDRFGTYDAGAHASGLEVLTQLTATGRLPWSHRLAAFDPIDTDLKAQPVLVRRLCPDFRKHVCKLLSDRLALRCALAGVAAERFRVAHGRWPATADELVPAFLAEVAADPVTDRPLTVVCHPDGIAFGAADPNNSTGARIEFRLWDVPHRNQPPPGDVP